MTSRFSEESAAGDVWQAKLQQMENELALAQYEAQKWKEKYTVEKARRQKIARDLLDLVVLTEHLHPGDGNGGGGDDFNDNPAFQAVMRRSSRLLSGADNTANLLSPTLSSFDFDDDSSEEDDPESDEDGKMPPTPPLVAAARRSSVVALEATDMASKDSKPANLRSAMRTIDVNESVNPSIALELRDRQSPMHHLNSARSNSRLNSGVSGRSQRSSTTGSAMEAFGDASSRKLVDSKNGGDKQQLMYRIMYAKPSSRDLWHARAHPTKLQNVARSILFSMHLKKEHIFEHFFVTGMMLQDEAQQRQQSTEMDLTGYWKPRLLYEFPHRTNGTPDESVADFCFPQGVPLVMCTPEQVAALQGAVVSKWFTDVELLQKHINEDPHTSGYTFRLTGAKGEVLYGFCVTVMKTVKEHVANPTATSASAPRSPRSNWTTRAVPSSKGGDKSKTEIMAPVCYCFTSKFPFYRFHFSLLRMIAENEVMQQAAQGSEPEGADKDFEVILRPKLDLAVELSLFHEENESKRERAVNASDASGQNGLNSIASKMSPSDGHVVLSEDASADGITGINGTDDLLLNGDKKKKKRPSTLRKSLSTDDISFYNFTNGWIVEKPVVKSIGENCPSEYACIQVGDVLEAIDSIATASMSFDDTLELLKKGDRPMRLRFRRPQSTSPSPSPSATLAGSKRYPQGLSPSSIDILYRARRMKINDPGHWSTARLPAYDLSYQFPKRHSDRWSCGVVLHFLTPERVVEVLASLLLEKQVVIMGDSPAEVTAVCTALLLLLAPFQWQSTYIPLLPSGLLDFLHSPVPFLAGCHSLDDTSEWTDVCFYDIDKDQIAVPREMQHLGPTSIPNGVELCRLLRTAKQRLCALPPSIRPWYELSDEEDKIITLTLQESEIFLRDLGFDISSQDLEASTSGGKSFYDRLQEEVAKEVRNSIFEDYLDEFTQTQLFCQYYESLLQPEAQDGKH